VSTTRAEPPQAVAGQTLAFGQLGRAAAIAVLGSALSGMMASTFYSLVPAWMQDEGIDQSTIALFMFAAVLGGLVFQVPVGWVSDRVDRRRVLAVLGLGFACTACSSFSCRTGRGSSSRLPRSLVASWPRSTRSASLSRTIACRPTWWWPSARA
jgi:MFS family permease